MRYKLDNYIKKIILDECIIDKNKIKQGMKIRLYERWAYDTGNNNLVFNSSPLTMPNNFYDRTEWRDLGINEVIIVECKKIIFRDYILSIESLMSNFYMIEVIK